MSDGLEGVIFLCLEVEFEAMMIGGVEGLVAGAGSVPEDEGGVVWGFELVAVEFGAEIVKRVPVDLVYGMILSILF
jgi:hypothetical protein